MTNSQGWVSLHRKLLDNPIFKNHKLLQTFLYCLLKASHSDRDQLIGDDIVPIKIGQLVTGRKALAYATGLTEQNVRTALTKLEKLQILTIKPTTKYSVITVLSWDTYQQANQEVTNSQPTSNQQVTTNNNSNNLNNSNKKRKPAFAAPTRNDVYEYLIGKQVNQSLALKESEKFFDYYESKGWLVGKSKMKKWESAANNWIKRSGEYERQQNNSKQDSKSILDSGNDWADDIYIPGVDGPAKSNH